MRWILLILLSCPVTLLATCLDNDDPAYNLAVSAGDYAKAFAIVAQELHLSPGDQRQFKIIEGFGRNHDDRHGQADPDAQELHLDPQLFLEGKEGACQGIAHELTHLRQFRRDRSRLHTYYATHPVPESGWNGCDRDTLEKRDAGQTEQQAYDCLQDNAVVPHTAADEIEAVLAQIPYAARHMLRDEDLSYLGDNLTHWADHQVMVTDHSNESYFLPEIKREDIRLFCRGFDQTRKRFGNTAPALSAWEYFCRFRH